MIFEKIENLAKKKEITITALEKELGFGNATIRGWRESYPTVDKLKKVADYFGVLVDYFLE